MRAEIEMIIILCILILFLIFISSLIIGAFVGFLDEWHEKDIIEKEKKYIEMQHELTALSLKYYMTCKSPCSCNLGIGDEIK